MLFQRQAELGRKLEMVRLIPKAMVVSFFGILQIIQLVFLEDMVLGTLKIGYGKTVLLGQTLM